MGNDKQGGGVRVGSASSIEIDFYFRGVRCRERIALTPTPPHIKYCTKLKANIEHEIATGQFDYAKHFPNSARVKTFSKKLPGDALTIGEYLEKWLGVEKQSIRPSTLWGYEKILKHSLRPAFGELSLTELKRKHLWDWIAEHQDMSAKRTRNILSVLRIALNDAVEQELIESNPLIGFKARKRGRQNASRRYEAEPFSSEEREAILLALEGQNRNLIQFAFWTGLRTSELIALDWSDVDFRRGVVVITKVLTVGMEEPEEGTKTEAGRREVTLLPAALRALNAQKPHTFLKGVEVFQSPLTGERWKGDRRIREGMWTSGLKRAKVRYRNPYQTRHTYASMMLMGGESVMWVAAQMGHTNWALTAARYSRWIRADMPNAGAQAAAMWDAEALALGQHSVNMRPQLAENKVPEKGLEPPRY